jgi:predicted phosphoadenosine phosphosulfate sulfurtransferase
MMRERILDIDTVTAARKRIVNIFGNGLPVYMSFSGGKDSLVLAHITLQLIDEGAIDPTLLRVEFIDEEAIFPCVERIVLKWRDIFQQRGARFDWYCLEVKHYSCLNMLENDESFICWDRHKRDVWVREPPAFAITDHPLLKPREDSYQQFLHRLSDGLHMTGVRASESVQRRTFLSKLQISGVPGSMATSAIHPIYDMTNDDVWLYLRDHDIEVPDAYVYLYQIGCTRNQLRISQFFSIDTCATLSRMAQYYPGLMERILAREPAAYLVSLYWNSEMFRRTSQTRKQIEEAGETAVNQKQRLIELLSKPPETLLRSKSSLAVLSSYRIMLLRFGGMMTEEHCKLACDALLSGDPKQRAKRALINQIVIHARKAHEQAAAPDATSAGRKRADRPARQPRAQRLQPQHRAGRQPRAAYPINPD